MGKLKFSASVSLDGFSAGPGQDRDNPLGAGGRALHEWAFATRTFHEMQGRDGGDTGVDDRQAGAWSDDTGATIMGRNMFGPVRGPWPDESWRGWWGEDPPYHHPVFVLTHHEREPLAMDGGTTFYFVTDGIASALKRAGDAAQGQDIGLAGGASVANQYLASGLVDEIDVSISPVILGGGERLFEGLERGGLELEQVLAVDGPGVTHIKYLVRR